MGLRLSPESTLVTHIDKGVDFLGWRIQRHRKRGTGKQYVYVYPAKKALKAVMAKGNGSMPAEHQPPARSPAVSAQPDAAGLDRVLQVRMLARDLQLPAVLPVAGNRQVAEAQSPAHAVEAAAQALRHLARRRCGHPVRPGKSRRQTLLLPGHEDRRTMAEHGVKDNACYRPIYLGTDR